MYDLIIIGGGPAGTAAAITAARGGARLLLLERGRLPRHKVCGEFVSSESLELLGTLLASPHDSLLRDAVRIFSSRIFLDGRVLQTPIRPAAASIARLDLDAALWESAVGAGVEARQQTVVQSITGTGPFRVATTDADFEGAAVINASGRWSNLNRTNEASGEKWLGVKAHFAETAPPNSVDLYFFEGGYCGVQPVDCGEPGRGRVNAAAMVRADVASTLLEVFSRHPVLLERSRHWLPLSDPVTTSPLIFRQPEPVRDGILLAGDAAGFVDPFVGDGISLALRGGALASQCLAEFFRQNVSLANATANYQMAYQQQFFSIFGASSQIRRMLRLPRAVRKPLLFVLENTSALTEYLVTRTR
jgi:flavin-dependent dehydrogenase